ncbi:hypothetical protein B0H16DRAFT_1734101 [Mycena metata]|uniref:Uncharacterized protein n=1 Tax=Mycena metata TaxID=1033252 RepID=A0AAD7MTC0_9AGAR|nr:hypothetical protein B0H16DRAFT_1734101 [Mycena metata]
MFAGLFPIEDTDMMVDARDEEMPDAPPRIIPTDPYRWNFEAQSNWNVPLRSGGVAQSTTRVETSATPPHTKYTIIPADIPPELWLEESNLALRSTATVRATDAEAETQGRGSSQPLYTPEWPKAGAKRPAPQVSTEEAENIRNLSEVETTRPFDRRRPVQVSNPFEFIRTLFILIRIRQNPVTKRNQISPTPTPTPTSTMPFARHQKALKARRRHGRLNPLRIPLVADLVHLLVATNAWRACTTINVAEMAAAAYGKD